MPGVTLRLSATEHVELAEAAKRNRRSMQAEIMHRLFPPDEILRTATGEVIGPRSRIWNPDREAKPDPKPGKKK